MDRAHDTGKPSDELPDASSREPPITASRGQWQTIASRRDAQGGTGQRPVATDDRDRRDTRDTSLLRNSDHREVLGTGDQPGRADFDALEALLKTRYGYWDDDIEHRSYFIHFQAG